MKTFNIANDILSDKALKRLHMTQDDVVDALHDLGKPYGAIRSCPRPISGAEATTATPGNITSNAASTSTSTQTPVTTQTLVTTQTQATTQTSTPASTGNRQASRRAPRQPSRKNVST